MFCKGLAPFSFHLIIALGGGGWVCILFLGSEHGGYKFC